MKREINKIKIENKMNNSNKEYKLRGVSWRQLVTMAALGLLSLDTHSFASAQCFTKSETYGKDEGDLLDDISVLESDSFSKQHRVSAIKLCEKDSRVIGI